MRTLLVLMALLLPLSACGTEASGVDDVHHLVSVLDATRPTSAEGWTRDVSASVCPVVTDRLHAVLVQSGVPFGVAVAQREIDGETEVRISRQLTLSGGTP